MWTNSDDNVFSNLAGFCNEIFWTSSNRVAQSYSPEDNRFDLRQFLYNATWPYLFGKIDEIVKGLNGDEIALKELGQQRTPQEDSVVGAGMGFVAAGSGDPKFGI